MGLMVSKDTMPSCGSLLGSLEIDLVATLFSLRTPAGFALNVLASGRDLSDTREVGVEIMKGSCSLSSLALVPFA